MATSSPLPRLRSRAVAIDAAAPAAYGNGLFGWQEAGFRTPVALAMLTEAGAVILLATALTLEPGAGGRDRGSEPRAGTR